MHRDHRLPPFAIAPFAIALFVSTLLGACAAPADGESTTSAPSELAAPAWALAELGHGTWDDAPAPSSPSSTPPNPAWRTVHGWVDARVANTRFEKRVFVEVAVPYDNGTTMRTMTPAFYKETQDDGAERWGTSAIELYPGSGPNGAAQAGPAVFRLRMQNDVDGDGRDEMIVTEWTALYGSGKPAAPRDDAWAPGLSSPVRTDATKGPTEVYFPYFDDAGAVVIREIDAVTAKKSADPGGRHTIHAAVFNINDGRIVDALVRAHRAGVEVRLITEARKFRPSAYWQTGDDALYAACVPLLGILRPGNGAMHDKFVVFDGRKVATGSFNWEWGSSFENHENMILSSAPELVAAYAQRFEVISGQVQRRRTAATELGAPASAFFGPDEPLYRTVGALIDGAKSSLHIAMFTAKDFEFDENGARTSLLKKVLAAKARGVSVHFMTDFGIATGAEYFGVTGEVDPTYLWLEQSGVHVVLGDPQTARYASMHHKFMVVDGKLAVTGAFNWYYDAAFLNDEDIVVLRDPAVAARFVGEFADLARRYDPAFDPTAFAQVTVNFVANDRNTAWGDQLLVVGDLPALGAWNPARALVLDGATWPTWRAPLTLPAGTRFEYKLALRHADGTIAWEAGENRRAMAETGVATADLASTYR